MYKIMLIFYIYTRILIRIRVYGRNMKKSTTVIQQRIKNVLSKIHICIQRQKIFYTWEK